MGQEGGGDKNLTHELVFTSLLSYLPRLSRGSPLLNSDIKILTTRTNLDHKPPNEWDRLWSWQVQKHIGE